MTAILYVEDDPRSRKVMNLLLRGSMGLSDVTILEDSEDFLKKVLALNPVPEVIFLDIHVAPHNGFEMLKMLKSNPTLKDIPVIALTASVMNEEIDQLQQAGFQGCLAKPIDADSFPEVLKRIQAGEVVWQIIN
jgi:CheY-like chemotaxis protein